MHMPSRAATAFVVAVALAACTPIAPTTSPSTAPAATALASVPRGSATGPTPTVAPTPSHPSPAVSLDPSRFRALSPLSEPRYEHTATQLLDGRVMVIGGQFSDFVAGGTPEVLDSVEVLDLTTGTWSAGTPMHRPRAGHTTMLLQGGRILVVGGDHRRSGEERKPSLEMFDPSTTSWDLIDDPPIYLRGAVQLLAGSVLLLGDLGDGSNKSYSTVFDPSKATFGPVERIPGMSINPTGTRLFNGNVLVAGSWRGHADGPPELRAEAAIFDPGLGAWSTTTPMHVARPPSSVVTMIDGRALIVSGMTGELFDPSTASWTLTGPTISERDGTTLVPFGDGRLLAIGSFSGSIDAVPIIESLDLATNAWAEFAQFRVLEGLTVTPVADDAILLTGGLLECRFGQDCQNQRVVADAFLMDTSAP